MLRLPPEGVKRWRCRAWLNNAWLGPVSPCLRVIDQINCS
jgi:hypothetical protein